ncbi:unnamed protein product, partial [Ixodes pacificus]
VPRSASRTTRRTGRKMYFDLVLLLLVLGVLCDGEEAKEPKIEPVEDDNVMKLAEFAHVAENFDDLDAFKDRWVLSEATKDAAADSVANYDGKWHVEAAALNHLRGGVGLVLKTKARHHAIAAKLDKPYVFEHKPFVVQYEENGDLRRFHKSHYTIMFVPDQCGTDYKLHHIFRHRNPRDGSYERHWKKYGGISRF